MSETPRAYTSDEVRDSLLRHVCHLVKYWGNVDTRNCEDKLEGLAFSILTALDGSSMELPKFTVTPDPHPEDKQYCIEIGDNWFEAEGDISGGLHEHFYRVMAEEFGEKMKR